MRVPKSTGTNTRRLDRRQGSASEASAMVIPAAEKKLKDKYCTPSPPFKIPHNLSFPRNMVVPAALLAGSRYTRLYAALRPPKRGIKGCLSPQVSKRSRVRRVRFSFCALRIVAFFRRREEKTQRNRTRQPLELLRLPRFACRLLRKACGNSNIFGCSLKATCRRLTPQSKTVTCFSGVSIAPGWHEFLRS